MLRHTHPWVSSPLVKTFALACHPEIQHFECDAMTERQFGVISCGKGLSIFYTWNRYLRTS